MKNITIYSTPSCMYCKMAKAYFAEKGVQYVDKNVAVDEAAREEMVKKSGQLGVPVIDVDGALVIGFDKERLAALIGK
ncbi:MAG: Glutaredoxin-like protein, YruB-family [Parcubacteria group bacterium GW2011_GWA1_60_11]|uniref:NrdH-redoxin n=1 Tax=Candidatus Liptonbacteria bacterium RIFCSPHIGHO2_12_FULL_60_13 TaxID=1798648 RepID=A0A1G2CHM8_9BACT|nr:MAG: Glutaredoxin-like protein, YruB-family [Parcubacteria group bacterium GW2011_GWA1_60_11]OGY99917.1 MAG: NrdH-redoxin [Candidatus Liptonbacteria bacterium RIFCSPHIGHO2_12_FULL_60_13]